MTRKRSPSPATRETLFILAAHEDGLHGYDISRQTGVPPGTLYPMLARLESQGLITAHWTPAAETGRPPRHIYCLTATGTALVHQLRAEHVSEAFHPRTFGVPR